MTQTQYRRFTARLAKFMIFIFALSGSFSSLSAHPHVWIEVRNAITFDDKQQIVAIGVNWRFDEFYSAFAVQGLDTNNDGKYSPKELASLLEDNLKEMAKADYFTQTIVDGKVQPYSKAINPRVSFEDGLLSMQFSLILKTPVKTAGKIISISTYDPTYYIAMDLAEQQPVSILGVKTKRCGISIKRPQQSEPVTLNDSIATTDAQAALSYAQQFTSQIMIKCAP